VRTERGSAAIELTLVTPALLVLLLFVVFVGRLVQARASVDTAARDAARAASIAPGPDSAATAGQSAASADLDTGSTTCRHLTVDVDTADFRLGGIVSATVTCTVDLGDLGLLSVPATKSITSTFAEPVDTYENEITP
jgi:Flp pilus assembly protein TadG